MFLKAFTESCTTSDLLFKATCAKCSYDVTYAYSALKTPKISFVNVQSQPIVKFG